MTNTTPSSSISRRTLAKGAAWSVPAVSLAAAAPALAASPPSVQCEDITVKASCQPLSTGAKVVFNICTTNGQPLPVGTVLEFSANGLSFGGWNFNGSLVDNSSVSGHTFTITAPQACYELEVTPDSSAPINIALVNLCLCVTQVPGAGSNGQCEGLCASKKVKLKCIFGHGVFAFCI